MQTLTPPPTKAAPKLSVIGRQCIAAICVQRFCAHYGIRHPAIDAFVEHLWGVATVTSDTFTEWELAFQNLPASTWDEPLPPELLAVMPPPLVADYSRLADAAVECSAATWYASDIPATLAAFDVVCDVMRTHGIPLPRFDPFLVSSPDTREGWGNRPTPAELRQWRAEA